MNRFIIGTNRHARGDVEHGQLVTKGENLSLQGGAGPKTGGEESENSNQNRVHRRGNQHPTNDGNLCVFKSDGVFGTHNVPTRQINEMRTN